MAAPRFDDIEGEVHGTPQQATQAAPRFDAIEGDLQDPAKDAADDPGVWGSLWRQYGQGFTKNFGDEIAGSLAARMTFEGPYSKKDGAGNVQTVNDVGQEADERTAHIRKVLETGADKHPVASFVGNVAGEIASDVAINRLTGIPVTSLPYQMASGAVSGAGMADDKMPRAAGGALGAGLALVGHGVGKYAIAPALRKAASVGSGLLSSISDPVREFVEKKINSAVTQEAAEQAAKKEKLVRRAAGALGGEAAAGIKTLERLEQAAADESLPSEIRKAAADHLASPEMKALKERALQNYVEKAPEQMGRINAAEEGLAEARGLNVDEATEEALTDPMKKHVVPRVATLGHRVLPAVLAGIGGMVGGPAGAAVGGGVGATYALLQGRPGIIIRNMVREPAVRKAFWESALRLVPNVGAAHQAVIPVLEKAALEGEQKFATTAFVLSQQNPAAREVLNAIAKAAESFGQDGPDGDQMAER